MDWCDRHGFNCDPKHFQAFQNPSLSPWINDNWSANNGFQSDTFIYAVNKLWINLHGEGAQLKR